MIHNLDQYYEGKQMAHLRSMKTIPLGSPNDGEAGEQDESGVGEGNDDNVNAMISQVVEASASLTADESGQYGTLYVAPPPGVVRNEISLIGRDDLVTTWDQVVTDSSDFIFPKKGGLLTCGPAERTAHFVSLIEELERLNREQKAAFVLLGSYLLTTEVMVHSATLPDEWLQRGNDAIEKSRNGGEGMYMILHGAAGTGKSRVILALRFFAQGWGLEHYMLITATTGVAAVLLGGCTYQAALGFMVKGDGIKENVKKHFAEGHVSLLIIDEMSMLGAKKELSKIDIRLRRLANRPIPFGGVGICLVGDFFQLSPVLGWALYSTAATDGEVRVLIELYLSCFKTAIALQENMRQKDDPRYVAVLEALRHPPIPAHIVETLNQRHVSSAQSSNESECEWAPKAVKLNAQRAKILKDIIREACRRHSHDPVRYPPVYAIPATFKFRKSGPNNEAWARILSSSLDSQLEYLPPVLYCYVGQRVMISKSSSEEVAIGVANRTLGMIVGFV